ncbi:unnamed protein product [Effrenium voratum]|uniref:Uncharacterized protein n=1 Tax=Effrenium voratum TaxID=2562239 RepID=A0AA36I259_9DINO|nr:unnamed protein product [Effrenium voratum]
MAPSCAGLLGICEFDPEHTPLPLDLADPALPKWYAKWLENYKRRDAWREAFQVFGPLPIQPLRPFSPRLRAPAAPAPRAEPRPRCPACLMALEGGSCPLDPSHDVSQPAVDGGGGAGAGALPRVAAVLPRLAAKETAVTPQAASFDRSESDRLQSLGLAASITEWLQQVDGQGFLGAYHAIMAEHFDSPWQLLDVEW